MRRSVIETIEKLNGKREATVVALGIFLIDTCYRDASTVQAGADWSVRAEKSLQSTFVAPEVTDDLGLPSHNLDVALDVGLFAGSTLLARSTSTTGELVATAASAQVLSSAADGLVAHAGLLKPAEMLQPDVGSSAIFSAFSMKFFMDRIAASQNHKKAWASGAVALAGALTFGAALIDSKNGTLDFVSHGVGALTGFGASKFSHRQSGFTLGSLSNNAAAEAFVTAIEDGGLTGG